MAIKAHRMNLNPPKTYATRENAIKAVEHVYGANHDHAGSADVRYIIVQHEVGRYFPLFIGERAANFGVHFQFAVAN